MFRFVKADADNRAQALDLAYYTAWSAGRYTNLAMAGKQPRFEKERPSKTKADKPVKRQSWRLMKNIALMLNALHGGDRISRPETSDDPSD